MRILPYSNRQSTRLDESADKLGTSSNFAVKDSIRRSRKLIATSYRETLRTRLISQAKRSVPRTMGSIISALIVSCLSCLHNPEAFGDPQAMHDQNGICDGDCVCQKDDIRLGHS